MAVAGGSFLLAVVVMTMVVQTAIAENTVDYPNLLFMMSDQQRSDTLGAVVSSLSTPNLDRIANEGLHRKSFLYCKSRLWRVFIRV